MVQKSGDHQLRLVVELLLFTGFCTSQVVSRISAINSMGDEILPSYIRITLKKSLTNQYFMECHVRVLITALLKSHEPRKKISYFPLYFSFNRDPYNGLL